MAGIRAGTALKVTKFIDHYLRTGSISDSAKLAGAKGNSVAALYVTGKKWLDKANLPLKDLQDMMGITDSYLTNRLKDGLTSTRKYYGTWQGEIVESDPFEDMPTRAKYLELAHKLRGQLVDKHEVTGAGGGDLVFQVGPTSRSKGDGAIEIE